MDHKGILEHNSQGRLQLPDGYYFTSGEPIEIFIDDKWIKGRIEYSHKYEDYYFMNDDDIVVYDISGMMARIGG